MAAVVCAEPLATSFLTGIWRQRVWLASSVELPVTVFGIWLVTSGQAMLGEVVAHGLEQWFVAQGQGVRTGRRGPGPQRAAVA